ncbi:hypothetical protein Cgig2_018325 [Carnegiea gigantea]|uniref:Uncharacterized protein n=1 Tax=Carnegiea gigantea TaxID=171969 RepID=A0A9Q1KVJ6_9CARY|nr:hypothetical protein Cgig2_018325 [Carnegiea gigantea]
MTAVLTKPFKEMPCYKRDIKAYIERMVEHRHKMQLQKFLLGLESLRVASAITSSRWPERDSPCVAPSTILRQERRDKFSSIAASANLEITFSSIIVNIKNSLRKEFDSNRTGSFGSTTATEREWNSSLFNGFPTSSSMKPYPCLKPNGNKMHYIRSKLKLKLTSKEISPATNANCGTLKGLRGQNANSDGRERIASPTVKAIYRTKEATTQISQHRDKRLLKHKNREDAAQKFSSESLDHPHSAITSYKPLTR